MLLRSIVEQLDLELSRLGALRDIVAGLNGTSPALESLPSPIALVAEVAPEKKGEPAAGSPQKRIRSTTRRAPRTPVSAGKAPGPTPLRHEIPRGPVVVSPGQLARERAQRLPVNQEATQPLVADKPESAADIEGQTRALASRWISGSVAS